MQCGIGHCGHCQLGPTLVCRDGPVYRWPEISRGLRSGSCDEHHERGPDDSQSEARGVEVLLLRRLPAQPARLRGRAAGGRRSAGDPYFLEATSAPSKDRTTCRWSRARSPPRRRRSGSGRYAPAREALITIGACATAGGIQALRNFADVEEFTRLVYATPRVHLDARDLDADQRQRSRRLRASGLPDQQGATAGGDQRLPESSPAPGACAQPCASSASGAGTVCVMVAHGTPCLGPVTHAGCGAICPLTTAAATAAMAPRRTPNTASLDAWSGLEEHDLVRVYRTYNAGRGRIQGDKREAMSTRRVIRTEALARVEGEGAMYVADRGRPGS